MEMLNPCIGAQLGPKTVSYTGTAGSTGTWPAGPQGVVVTVTSAAYVLVGENVTATTSDGTYVPANVAIPFKIPTGTGAPWRVSAIQVSAAGDIYAKPVNKQ
jgi:hypothetical protein